MKYIVTLNNKKYEVDVTETDAVITAVTAVSAEPPAAAPAPVSAPAPAPKPETDGTLADGVKVKAPMPGSIIDVKVRVGQRVKTGDVMFLLEAMKMENEVVAPEDGTVKQIVAAKGSAVETDAVLAVI